jgi:hypothetical protein
MARVLEGKLEELKGCCGSERVERVLDAVRGLLWWMRRNESRVKGSLIFA